MSNETGSRRRYEKLRALARDQRGKPEGDLAARLADTMLERDPSLARADAPDLPTRLRPYPWKTETEQALLQWICEWLGVDALGWRDKRKRREVLADVDDPTDAVILQAFKALREQAERVVVYARTSFLMGALPLPVKPSDDDKDDSPPIDLAMMELLMGARMVGRRSAPDLRKALPPTKD